MGLRSSKNKPKNFADYFWSKANKTDTCWIWTAGKSNRKNNYGAFWSESGTVAAHRYAHKLINGPIPKGIQVLHRCDNPPCVRPSHLFLGTNKDNVEDRVRKGRTGPRCGSFNGNSRLSENKVIQIRRLLLQGIAKTKIAKKYKVSDTCIRHIAQGITWTSVVSLA